MAINTSTMILVVSVDDTENLDMGSLPEGMFEKASRSRIVLAVDKKGRSKLLKNNYGTGSVQFLSEEDA